MARKKPVFLDAPSTAAAAADDMPAGIPTSLALMLWDTGRTLDEIAADTGRGVGELSAELAALGADLGPAHALRLKAAQYARALPGVGWKDAATQAGAVKLEYSTPGDTAAADKLLCVLEPERYAVKVPAMAIAVTVATFDADGRRVAVQAKGQLAAGIDPPGTITAGPIGADRKSTRLNSSHRL